MNIGIFGTGFVGQTLAAKLHSLGHNVAIGTRNIENTLGNVRFSDWHKQYPDIKLLVFSEAAIHGEILLNCTPGTVSLEVLKSAGKENIDSKILIDISNPLDSSGGMPPVLAVCNTDSLGEQIQRAYPDLRVVKTLNTTNALLMANPSLLPGDHNLFMSGNDEQAKTQVRDILVSFGWKVNNIIDLGDITTARGTEQLLPVWLRLYGKLGSPMFNFHVVTEQA